MLDYLFILREGEYVIMKYAYLRNLKNYVYLPMRISIIFIQKCFMVFSMMSKKTDVNLLDARIGNPEGVILKISTGF